MRLTYHYLKECIRLNANGEIESLPQPRSSASVQTNTLKVKSDRLLQYQVDPVVLDRLKRFITEGEDEKVTSIQPYKLADQWGIQRYELLKVFLYGTRVGLFNLSWVLLCPNCRVKKSEVQTLADLNGSVHCELCGIDYNADFDKFIELQFSVHPSIRNVFPQVFCTGGPFLTPHIEEQRIIQPGDHHVFRPNTNHELRLRILKSNHTVRVPNDAGALMAGYDGSRWMVEPDSVAPIEPSSPKTNLVKDADGNEIQQTVLEVANTGVEPVVVALEIEAWDPDRVTAAEVTALQEFRDLFSSEVLAPGTQVHVENIVVLFSDLKGSTSLYEKVGDAKAYGNVRNHFDYMTEWVKKNKGAIVKTIGDAVMAVFMKEADAVSAALDIQKNLKTFNEKFSDTEPIQIKLGLHGGPTIAVNSNDRLDYFGRTVNIAARTQGESEGNDIVISESTFNEPSVQAVLKDQSIDISQYAVQLKGIEETMTLMRLQAIGSWSDSKGVPTQDTTDNREHVPASRE